jgi:hypothetical protein
MHLLARPPAVAVTVAAAFDVQLKAGVAVTGEAAVHRY